MAMPCEDNTEMCAGLEIRIIESFELEGTFELQPPCNEQGCLQLDQGAQSPSSLILNVYNDGTPTMCHFTAR